MKNYEIFYRDEKKLLFENFERDIIELLKTHNVFFIIGILEFEEFIKLSLILYEKKFHTLNENSRLCITFPDNIFARSYDLIDDDLREFFTPLLNDYDEKDGNVHRNNKIVLLDESKLLQKILFDPLLIEFNIIILTNVHRRLTKTDLILSLLKKILLKRNDIFIFIFSNFFIENVLNFFSSHGSVQICQKIESSIGDEKEECESVDIQCDVSNLEKWKEETEHHERKDDKTVEEFDDKKLCRFHKGEQSISARRESNLQTNFDNTEDIKIEKKDTNDYIPAKTLVHQNEWKDLTKENEKNADNFILKNDIFPQYHFYKNKHERRNYGKGSIEGKKYFSLKNKKLKDIISRRNYYARSRSSTLSNDEEGNENCIPREENENFDLSSSDMEKPVNKKIKHKNSIEGAIKGRNVPHLIFENSARHSLMYDCKEGVDFMTPKSNHIPHNGKGEINKMLEEWKEFAERLGKVNKKINIFVFHISNESSYNKRKGIKMSQSTCDSIYYLKNRCSNYLHTSIMLANKLFKNKKKSRENILIFLNNEHEIDVVMKGFQNENIESDKIVIVYDVHGNDIDLCELQNKIIIVKDDEFYYKKLKNVKYVIDTCFMKDKIYDYDMNVTNKYTILCNKNKCEERRLVCNDSICFRLITMNDYMNLLNEFCIPEILKKDIFYNIYFLKTLGIKNVCSFDFVTAPTLKSLKRCFELFYILKLMDIDGNIIDKKLSLLICYLPLNFKYSIFLVNSIKYKCVYEVAVIISMLINEPIFLYKNKNLERLKTLRLPLMAEESDILSYYNIFQLFDKAKNRKSFCYDNFLVYKSVKKATKFFNRLKRILNNFGIEMEKSNNIEYVLKAKICSFFYNVSKVVNDNKYKLLNMRSRNELFYLDQLSILNESEQDKRKFIVYTDAYSNNESKIFLRHASVIDPLWLITECPSYFSNRHCSKPAELDA
ncbi:hypothetical protein, conserved [Plasmodium gonderi]|uniref:DEAD-box helicase OB fold domain-containing protein n=1 Tax=Plasmodium gonderi TaxID=77519 RepID=A0A1Y1JML5_PLAGO|nr:hypothetical protein, conserved [Plasmodium gonderi]GAW82715.1 hypothetical protein, conserved [Plasmodium gonderi]